MADLGALSQYALVAFSSVFIIVDPFATAPLFVTMTEGDTPVQRGRMARRASIAAWLTLTAFALGGDALLRLFSITLGAFRIAGGVILFGIGLNMLRLRESREIQTPEEVQEGVEKEDIALIPLVVFQINLWFLVVPCHTMSERRPYGTQTTQRRVTPRRI